MVMGVAGGVTVEGEDMAGVPPGSRMKAVTPV